MRNKKLKLIVILFVILGFKGLQAQTMDVNENSGTQTVYTLSNIQKMSFSSGNLTVTKTDNSSAEFALSDLRYLNFSDVLTNLQEDWPVQSQLLSIYPNPVIHTIHINLKGISKEAGTLSLLNLEGKTLFNQQVGDASLITLDMSHLPAGIYLCRYSNASEIKTVKIIKQ